MDVILAEMARIYGLFCMPVAIVDTLTGSVEIKTEWISFSAEEYYKTLSEMLSYLNREIKAVTNA